MNTRQRQLLSHIIREYIKSASPIGSETLVDKYKVKVSSATVRHEMAALEKEDLIFQPHTSAGRVPTEKGYKFFIKNLTYDTKLKAKDKEILNKIKQEKSFDKEILIKNLAKQVAEMANNSVLVGFSPENFYYTGLSNLFSQPEFLKLNYLVYNISSIIDQMDEVMEKIFNLVSCEVKVLIGKENPFGEECSFITTKYQINKKKEGIFGILGPMRMDYPNNIALVNYVKELCEL